MARAARVKRGGPGYAGLIAFIVLSLVLIAGYAWLVPQYAKVCGSLDEMHGYVKEHIEDRVGTPLGVRGTFRAKNVDLGYDAAFFLKVGQAAEEGLKYPELEKLAGWTGEDEEGKDAIERIKVELNKMTPAPDNLQDYVLALNKERGQAELRRRATETERQRAVAARDEAVRLSEGRRKRMDEERSEAEAKFDASREQYNTQIAEMKRVTNDAEAGAKKAWAELATVKERRKEEVEQLQGRIQRLDQEVLDLQDQLQAKQPKKLAVKEGRILQVDLVEGRAVIDLGQRERIQDGEELVVMHVGRGGERIPKGTLKVVRVEELVSRADIISAEPEAIIMRDDVVSRVRDVEALQ